MDQIGDELKKVLQAGIGAVAVGVEKTQEAIEKLSKKGEPIYEQARKTVTDTAGKVKQAVSECCRTRADDVIAALGALTREDRARVRAALDELDAAQTDDEKEQEAEATEKDGMDGPDL